MSNIFKLRYKMFRLVNVFFYLLLFGIGFFFGFTGKKIINLIPNVSALESVEVVEEHTDYEIVEDDNYISVNYMPFFIKKNVYNQFVQAHYPMVSENVLFVGYIGINIMFYVGLFILIYVFKFLILSFKNACF